MYVKDVSHKSDELYVPGCAGKIRISRKKKPFQLKLKVSIDSTL